MDIEEWGLAQLEVERHVQIEERGPSVVLTFRGEWDITYASELRQHLLTALRTEPLVLALDLSDVTFFDSAALNALVAAWRRAQLVGSEIRLVAPSPILTKILHITGVDQVLPSYPNVVSALDASPAVPD